jgi:hypothetical protein
MQVMVIPLVGQLSFDRRGQALQTAAPFPGSKACLLPKRFEEIQMTLQGI